MKNNNTPQAKSPLNKWLHYITNLYDKHIDMNLDRISEVAIRLGVLRPAPFFFTVSGTNGKGTTCCTLEAILIAANYKVGVYNSPHLINYTERIRIQNSELPEHLHSTSFAEVEAVRGNIPLTYFEYSTLSALWIFKQAKLDVVILEVGLGGRLDATNIIDTDIAIITNIALDHTEWLGSNRESIGREKAGIFRSNKPAVIGESDIPKTILKIAQEKKVRLLKRNIDWRFLMFENTWCYSDEYGEVVNLPLPKVPQPNAATAIAAIRASPFKVDNQSIVEGIKNAALPGRFQVVSESPRLILDVAHNPHAAKYLTKCLKSIPKTGRVLAIIGMLKEKDIVGTLAYMEHVIDEFYFASLKEERSANAEQIMKKFGKGRAYGSVAQAWRAAMNDAYPEDTLLVCGSFYTVSNVMKEINN